MFYFFNVGFEVFNIYIPCSQEKNYLFNVEFEAL